MASGCQTSVKVTATIRKSGTKPTLQIQIIRFIIAVLGCCGSIFTVLTAFETNVSNTLVLAVIIGMCILTNTFRLKNKIAYPAIALSAAGCITGAFILKNSFSAGFAGFLNIYASTAKVAFRSKQFIPIIEPELAEQHMTIFVVYSAVLICFLAGYLLVRCDSGLYTLFVFTVPVIPVFMIGLEPSPLAFAALIISFVAMMVLEFTTTNTVHNQQFIRYGIECSAAAAVAAALCFALVFGITKAIDYERPQALDDIFTKADNYLDSGELKNDIKETISQIMGDYHVYGAINHGKLDEFGKIRFEFKDVLQVTMPRSEDTVYLRGFVGSVYTGRSWEELPDSKLRQLENITDNFITEGLSPLILDGYNMKYSPVKLSSYNFSVKNIAANDDYMYMPYNLVPESVLRYEIIDGSYFTSNDKSYFGQFYDPDDYYGYQNLFKRRWSVPHVLSSDEAIYRNFVYENYLEIPDTFDPSVIFNQSYYDYITAEEFQTGKSTLDEMTVFGRKLYYIRNWLRDNCTYTLTTEPLPKGRDFVNHFLEHKEGSCSHFASTAVMMCRYAGIPARYVEGYVITPYDYDSDIAPGTVTTVNVQDTHGHAWVEIYIDGYGWYPMEFTSGYGNVRTAFPTETTVTEEPALESEPEITTETTVTSNEEVEDNQTAPQLQETETDITNTNISENTGEKVTTAPSEKTETQASQPAESNPQQSVGFGIFGIEGKNKVDVVYDLTWVLILILFIITIPTAIILRRHFILLRRKSAKTPIAQITADYKRFCKLLKLMDMPEQGGLTYSEFAELLSQRSAFLADGNASQIISIALKASFGGNIVTREDSNEMQFAVTSLAKRYCQTLTVFGKFRIKFIYCII